METKKFVKKIAALAGSAAMLGATVAGALAALPSLPGPFVTSGVFDAYVAVGASANVADVVSAIELGAAFAQSATSGGSGVVTFEKNVSAGLLNSTGEEGIAIKGTAQPVTFNTASDGFDWLFNGTVDYYNTTDKTTTLYTEQEKLAMGGGSGGPFVTDFAQVFFDLADEMVYNVSFNSTVPVETSGIKWLGDTYELVSSSTTEVILGQIETETITVGEEFSVGDMGALVKVTDMDSVLNEVYFVVEDASGNVVYEDWLAQGESYSNTTLGINNIQITSFHYSVLTQEATVKLDVRTAALTLEKGNLTYDDKFEVDLSATSSGLNWLALKSVQGYPAAYGEDPVYINPGSVIAGPGNYWYFYYDGLKMSNNGDDTTTVTVKTEFSEDITYEFSFKNSDGDAVSVDLDTIHLDSTDFDEYPVATPTYNRTTLGINLQGTPYYIKIYGNGTAGWSWVNVTFTNDTNVFTDVTPNSNLPFGNAYYNFAFTNGFADKTMNLTVYNYTANSDTEIVPYFDGAAYNLSYTNATRTLTIEDPGNDVMVNFDDNTLKVGGKTVTSTTRYTTYGTSGTLSGSIATIVVPETKRVADVSVGRKLPAEFTVSVGETDSRIDNAIITAGGGSTINKIAPTFAMMDTEIPSPTKPVILVGGPAVNTLVNSLGNKTWTLSNWQEFADGSYTKDNRAIIDLVADAFGTNDALVVAGFAADDTRIACRLLARELLFGDTVLGEEWAGLNRVVLDTTGVTVGDYTSATVVT
jgi:hypothetical protein